jgi:ketosteroid isomerase-like protein
MAESNVERLRRGYEALSRGDYEAVRELIDPKIVLRDRPEVPDARSYLGYEGMLTTLRDTSDSFEDFRLDPLEFFENGDRIVAVLDMTGRGRTSGVPVEERIAHLWTMRDGLAIELQAFTDPADALEAAGLPRARAGRVDD